jgi:DNA polymerase III delta subunit
LNNNITEVLIKENIFPELEESIFQVVDDIMNENIYEAIKKINIILSQTSVYAFYNNLLANLKVLVFIKNLKDKNISNIPEVLDLKNR